MDELASGSGVAMDVTCSIQILQQSEHRANRRSVGVAVPTAGFDTVDAPLAAPFVHHPTVPNQPSPMNDTTVVVLYSVEL